MPPLGAKPVVLILWPGVRTSAHGCNLDDVTWHVHCDVCVHNSAVKGMRFITGMERQILLYLVVCSFFVHCYFAIPTRALLDSFLLIRLPGAGSSSERCNPCRQGSFNAVTVGKGRGHHCLQINVLCNVAGSRGLAGCTHHMA